MDNGTREFQYTIGKLNYPVVAHINVVKEREQGFDVLIYQDAMIDSKQPAIAVFSMNALKPIKIGMSEELQTPFDDDKYLIEVMKRVLKEFNVK